MRFTVNDTELSGYTCDSAILLYSHKDSTIAVRHRVIHSKAGSRLGVGRFVTETMLKSILELFDRSRAPLKYIPNNVVALSRNAVAWYEPARKQTMFFKPQTDSAVKAFDGVQVPQPPLLFIACNRDLSVYALNDDARPTLETPLARAPYWNVFDSNTVCIGSMPLPKRVAPDETAGWTKAFFASNFTHLSSQAARWRFPGTYAELLGAAITAGRFDPDWLIPTNTTVQGAICGD